MRLIASLLLLPLIAGCAAVPPPPVAPQPRSQPAAPQVLRPRAQSPVPPTLPARPPRPDFLAPEVLRAPGLEDVIRHDAASLVRRFGDPRLDTREGDMRKLQFSGRACVLDVFLYPLREGAEPVATWVEARRASDGQEVDRAACVQALRSAQ
jgi:hypothetical protein